MIKNYFFFFQAKKTVEAMLAKYDWIAVDMRFFGQPNTAYDFSANDPKEAQKKIQKLEATKVSFELIHLFPYLVDSVSYLNRY